MVHYLLWHFQFWENMEWTFCSILFFPSPPFLKIMKLYINANENYKNSCIDIYMLSEYKKRHWLRNWIYLNVLHSCTWLYCNLTIHRNVIEVTFSSTWWLQLLIRSYIHCFICKCVTRIINHVCIINRGKTF